MTNRTTRLTFLCVGLFLFAFAISVVKPGLPTTLKADEPAYLMLAMSLLHDGDARAEEEDYERLFEAYPYLPVENLILSSDDGWKTVYYGKPYLYPLLSVPFAALFGTNGLVALNVLLFVALMWMGAEYLGRFNAEGTAILFSVAFFFLSPTFAYVFWLQPELLNMAAVMGSLFLVLHEFQPPGTAAGRLGELWRKAFNERTRPAWSGVILAFGAYNKPVLAIAALPILYVLWRRRGLKTVAVWCIASAAAMGVFAAGSVALTGHPTAYLGMSRFGVKLEDAADVPQAIGRIEEALKELSTTANSWSWFFDKPPVRWSDFVDRLGYFFWGRHTGFLIYTPFAVLAILLFLLHDRRSLTKWLTVGAALAFGVFFVFKIPLNWHGGGGFVGNRYFINIYPMFLFLVTAVRPLWTLPAASAVGGLFLGTIVFTPFGAPVPQPTLQAHTRSWPYKFLPLELSLRTAVPGYLSMSFDGVTILGRKDVFQHPRRQKTTMWLQGATRSNLLVLSAKPAEGFFFEVRTPVPDNEIRLELAGDLETLRFAGAKRARRRSQIVELRPEKISRLSRDLLQPKPYYVYELDVDIENGLRMGDENQPMEIFFLGAELEYLGRRAQITRPEHYRLEWLEAATPEAVEAGSVFEVPVRVRNWCKFPISSKGALGVRLTYHWTDADGQQIVHGGRRAGFSGEVKPGEEFEAVISVAAPAIPGSYRLELDAVREGIAWFSERGGQTHEVELEVARRGSLATESADPS